MDVEQYKMLNVKDDPIQSRQTHLDVMCFPTLFPSGQFGEFHPRDKHVSASEYAKSRLLNKDPRFRKDPQYIFFLLWQQEMRQISAGIYNVLKSTGKGKMPVHEFLAGVSKSDESIEANLFCQITNCLTPRLKTREKTTTILSCCCSSHFEMRVI